VGWATDEAKQRQAADPGFGVRFGGAPVWALVWLLGAAASGVAQTDFRRDTRTETPISFNVPAQSLASALEAYSATAGLEVFYDSNLAAGRRSTAVKGTIAPDVALRVLLEGTGLTVVYAEKAFAIVPAASPRQGDGSSLTSQIPYLTNIQREIERAFCRRPQSVPGQYRLALRFGIGTSGEVLHPQLLGSTGDPQRDELIADLLRDLNIGQSPPPGLPQPITMIVLPRPPAQTGDCGPPADDQPRSRTVQ
jgi:hypothetical protein